MIGVQKNKSGDDKKLYSQFELDIVRKLGELDGSVTNMGKDINKLLERQEKDFVKSNDFGNLKDRVKKLELIIFAVASLICTTVIGAIIRSVLKNG